MSTADVPNRLGKNLGIPPVPKRAKQSTTMGGAALGGGGKWLDERLGMAPKLRRTFNKVFPDHWSFMLGEIALYSFVILLLTGTYLTFFFKASSTDIVYHGSYMPLRGTTMTEAYASTLDISFDVRAGLIMRQIHHWAALMFVAAICVHMMRVFFTGAFRKPRELNWVIGVGLLVLAILEGFAGYSLPDDLLSGTGLRIAYSITESAPIMGSYMAWFLFGGDFPGDAFISRLYAVHILLIPGILVALISAHMALLVHQKHTQFPGPGRTETNVVGSRLFPGFSAKTGGFFFIVFGACAALASLFQINPIWLFGPYEARNVSAGSQPDWYMGFLDGSSRLMPGWELRIFGHTIPPIVWPAQVLPGILIGLVGAYPWIESKLTKDKNYHHLLDRPRDRPVRTAAGSAFIAFYIALWLSGGNDVIASVFHISLNATTFGGRILLIIAPPITYLVTKRICLNLQARASAVEHHGVETGFISMSPDGQYAEIHAPAPVPHHPTPHPVLPDDLRELDAGGDGHGANGSDGSPSGSGSRGDAARFAVGDGA